MQRLLRWADWDIDGVRDDVRAYVAERLGGQDAVLIADDTGFLKKGVKSAGVQRQYSGTAGRTENCQIGVFLAYASARGHALVDRELYLPESWTEDRSRCRAAGIPDAVEFATKPRLVIAMLARALAAKVPFGWFTADEAYGAVKYLRFWLEQHDIAHVLATRRNRPGRGSGSLPVPGHMGHATTTGPVSLSVFSGNPGADTGYWHDAASPTLPKSRTTSATDHAGPRSPIWRGSPGLDGASRSVSSRPRTKPASTTTRSAAGGPGMPTSPCPCSLWPGSQDPKPLP